MVMTDILGRKLRNYSAFLHYVVKLIGGEYRDLFIFIFADCDGL